MISVKESPLYKNVVKEFNYSFCNVYLFDGFVISEINEGVNFTWDDHAKKIVEDIAEYTDSNGVDLIYISHRIHSYAVNAVDWLKFYKHAFDLKGYGVVAYTQGSILNSVIENLFIRKKIKRFNSLEAAVQWATDKVFAELEQ